MEKRILIAAVLSAIFMTWYAQSVLRWSGAAQQPPPATSVEGVDVIATPAQRPLLTPAEPEDVVVLESDSIQLEIGKTSAAIRSVALKDFLDVTRSSPLRVRTAFPLVSVRINEALLQWSLTDQSHSAVSFEATDKSGNSYHISYAINYDNHNVDIMLYESMTSIKSNGSSVDILSTWAKADQLADRYNSLELIAMSIDASKQGKPKYAHYRAPIKAEKDVPRGTTVLSLSERYFCQLIRVADGGAATLMPSAQGTIAAQLRIPKEIPTSTEEAHLATIYFGPRDYFYLKAAGFDGAFPIGTLGQLGLMLLFLLSGIAKLTRNYGVAILLFSTLVTCALAPFTMISMRSMKKMQELKPQIDKIMAKHKDNPQLANREVFALYRERRVSPLSGCLPMLLPLPIFFAMFQAISHYIELRGKGFLWIADLSLPDRIAKLPFSLPLLGNDINALPILMAGAMFLQQQASQRNMPSSSSTPSMQMMSGPLMSIIFGVMFYEFPSGLVLYWLTNSLISLAWYRLAK
jgi:YidC/Oxa1 family membrane protein insertase